MEHAAAEEGFWGVLHWRKEAQSIPEEAGREKTLAVQGMGDNPPSTGF